MQTNIAASVSGRGIITISGSPPLTFTGQNTEVLKNYRIYGNTVNGASVGDKTANLCDEIYIPGNVLGSSSQRLKIEHTIPVTTGTTYTLSFVSSDFQLHIDSSPTSEYPFSGSTLTYCGNPSGWQSSDCTFTATNNGYIALTIRKKNNAVISADDIDFPVMFQVGAQASAYEPYGYRITLTLTADSAETTDIYLDEPLKMVGDEAEYIDYREQKMHRVRKNLLPNTATSQTINGITFTVKNDGGVTCNGTAGEGNALFFVPTITLPTGKYILSGCPAGGSEKTTFKQLIYANGVWLENDKGSGANFILTDAGEVSARIVIYSGYTCDNLTFYPMIRKVDIEDDTYEPYIENTEVDVILPGIAVTAGTNTLTVGTAVQPSSVEIKEIIRNITQTMTAMIRPMQRLTGKIKAASSGYSRGDHYTVPVGEYPAIKVNIKTVQSAGYQPEATEEGFTI